MIFLIIALAFLTGFAASVLSAGPVNFLILKNALIGRYKSSISMIIGASLMEAIYCGFALIITGLVLHNTKKINIVSVSISTAIFLIMGLYFLISDQSEKKLNLNISGKEIVVSFLVGFILVVMNPALIIGWSIAAGTLISWNIIKISRLFHVIVFIISVFLGIVAGGSLRVFLVKKLNIKFSDNFIRYTTKIIGLVFLIISLYFAYRLISVI